MMVDVMDSGLQVAFFHHQSAHCESGVVVNLLRHHGLAISEPMAFGVGQCLFFGYFPFIRINGLPLVTYRGAAGKIVKRFGSLAGFEMQRRTFRNKDRAMAELDAVLAENRPVGLQTGVFWLPYFPRALRFHFNAHNLVVYGKHGDEYLISDPVFPEPVRCPAADLARARFASGALAPRGAMYWFSEVPQQFDYPIQIRAGIHGVCRAMTGSPFPLIGCRAIRFLANRMERWPRRLGNKRAILHLGHVVRMQEEIGTGGGGFRFMYAAFLNEAADRLADDSLRAQAALLIETGDQWRSFAAMATRICKGRQQTGDSWPALAELLHDCAAREKRIFTDLCRWAEVSR